MATRILVVDDHPVTRTALRNALEETIESPTIVLAGSLEEGFRLAQTPFDHDLVLLDLCLPDATGVATVGAWCRRLPGSTVIALADAEDAALAEGCVAAGAIACLPKTREMRLIIATVQSAIDALVPLSDYRSTPAHPTGRKQDLAPLPDTTRHGTLGWASEHRGAPRSSIAGWPTQPGVRYGGAASPEPARAAMRCEDGRHLNLTPRQREVLRLLLQGQPNKRICRELNLAEGTVKVHVSAVLRALNVTNRAQAVVAAARMGIRID